MRGRLPSRSFRSLPMYSGLCYHDDDHRHEHKEKEKVCCPRRPLLCTVFRQRPLRFVGRGLRTNRFQPCLKPPVFSPFFPISLLAPLFEQTRKELSCDMDFVKVFRYFERNARPVMHRAINATD